MLILTITTLYILWINFVFFFIIYLFILFTQVLVTWSLPFMCVVKVKVDLRSCEDKVRVNYFQLS